MGLLMENIMKDNMFQFRRKSEKPLRGGLLKKARPAVKRYALSDILDSFAPSSTHPEVDFGKPRGKEAR